MTRGRDAVERGTYRSENGMTSAQLVHDHFLPRYRSGTNLATTTSRTVDSHFEPPQVWDVVSC